MPTFKHVLLIIIDNLGNDHFYRLLKSSVLFNLEKLSRNAFHLNHCITTFPSTTLPGHVSLLTGKYPDAFHIPSINFYQRESKSIVKFSDSFLSWVKLNDFIPQTVKTIYELFSEGESIAIFEGVSRGATQTYSLNDYLKKGISISDIFKQYAKNHQFKLPTLSVLWYYQPDPALHFYGPESKQYLDELKNVDYDIGKIISFLKEINQLKNTLVVITSDHGNYTAKERLDINQILQKHNLKPEKDYFVQFGSVGFFWFLDNLKNHKSLPFDVLRNYGSKRLDLIEIISSLKGVERVFYFNEKEKTVYGHKGGKIGTIESYGNKIRIKGDDIYDYKEDHLASQLSFNKLYDSKTLLKYTYNSKLPLLPDQLFRIFDNKNRPDLIACTDCKTVYNHIYSHDSYFQNVMNVPLMIYGQNIATKYYKYARIIT